MEENMQKMPHKEEGKKSGNIMRACFGIIMVVIYLGIGYLFCANGLFNSVPNRTYALIIGIVLMVYGVWRGYRLWRNWP